MSKRKWLIHEDSDNILSVGSTITIGDMDYVIGDEIRPSVSIYVINLNERSYTTETKGYGKCQVTLSRFLSENEFIDILESIIKGGPLF